METTVGQGDQKTERLELRKDILMLEVLPIQTKDEQETLCARARIPFRGDLLSVRLCQKHLLRGCIPVVHPGGLIVHTIIRPDQIDQYFQNVLTSPSNMSFRQDSALKH